MQCVTLKVGTECTFMAKGGCSYPGNICETIVDQCQGCAHTMESGGATYCETYASPKVKWSFGTCNFATHIERPEPAEQKKVNPLKASKRAGRR
jgi:hypothetical protein